MNKLVRLLVLVAVVSAYTVGVDALSTLRTRRMVISQAQACYDYVTKESPYVALLSANPNLLPRIQEACQAQASYNYFFPKL